MPKKKSGSRKAAARKKTAASRKKAARKKSATPRKKVARSRKKAPRKTDRRPTLVPTGSYRKDAVVGGPPAPPDQPPVTDHDPHDDGFDADYHDDDPREKYMSVGDHLEELRVRILWMIGVLVTFSVAAGVFSTYIHRFLIGPYTEVTGERLLLQSVVGPMEVYIKVSFITGLATALPVLTYILWGFVAPALSRRAALLGNGIVLCSTLLFWTGMAVCWFYIFPLSLQFMFVEILPEGIAPQTTVEKYYNFLFLLHVGAGIMFQMPLVVVILGALGIVTMAWHRATWKVFVTGIFVFSAAITPPDPLSLLIMGTLLLGLYGFSVMLVWLIERARRRK